MTIQWSRSALANIRAIEAFVEQQSPQGAQDLIDRIFERAQRLETMPRSGTMVTERNDPTLREVYERSYRIIYRIVDENVIEIATVVHAGKQLRGI